MQNYRYPADDSSPGMGTASLDLGICSLLLFITGLSLITGALGILFALLSRGSGSMKTSSKAGMILSTIGLALGIAVVSTILYFLLSGVFDSYSEQFWDLYNYYIDEDSDEIWELFDSHQTAVLDSPVFSAVAPAEWEFFEGDLL